MSALWAWWAEPFTYDFMVRAALGTLAVALAAPVLGWWAVSRRLVYLTDAMSHAVLAGVAAAALLGVGLLSGALAAALVMALLVAWLTVRANVPQDGAIGVVGQGLFALGVLGITVLDQPRTLEHLLFGNPLTLTWRDVAVQGLLAVVVVAMTARATPVLTATTFDPVHARTVGMRVGLVETALVVGLSLVMVIGLTTVGVLMTVTLAVAPAVAARTWARSMHSGMAWSAALGGAAGLLGLLVSYHGGLPAGPVVAVLAVSQVAAAVTVSRLAGIAGSRLPDQRPLLTGAR